MATIYWLGAAVPVPDEQTLSVGGTWLQSETVKFTLNGKDLTLTIGTTVTVTQVASDIVAMINGASANQDELRSALGTSAGEWDAVTATSAVGVVTLTGKADGRPVGTVSIDVTGTSSGTVAQAATANTGIGGLHFNTTDNWSGGAVPGAADTIVFDHRAAASCLYDLATIVAAAPAAIYVTRGFRFQIGLSEVNTDNPSLLYDEPNETYLQVASCADVKIDAAGGQMVKIDCGSAASTVIVNSSGSTTESAMPPVLLKVNHSSSIVTVRGGSVGVSIEPTTTGSIATVNVSGSGSLELGDTVTTVTANVDSGTLITQAGVTTINMSGGVCEQREGNVTTLNLYGGTFYPMTSGTYTTVYHVGGLMDCLKDARGRTFTNHNLYAGASLKDPLNTITSSNGMDIHGKIGSVQLDQAPRKTYTITDI